jgi:hypothetical protein
MATHRWSRRPQESDWGDFGEEDQLGRLNLETPEKVRQRLAEAKDGIVFSLSLPLDYPGGNGLSPALHPACRHRRSSWPNHGLDRGKLCSDVRHERSGRDSKHEARSERHAGTGQR